jgi:hypothetical protein
VTKKGWDVRIQAIKDRVKGKYCIDREKTNAEKIKLTTERLI